MNITSKSKYALKVMLDLGAAVSFKATGQGEKPRDVALTRRKPLSSRQAVPLEYLDQLLIKLRGAGLVESVRGPHGGYRLGKKTSEISVWDIFAAVEGQVVPVSCLAETGTCGAEHSCNAFDAWELIYESTSRPLKHLTLETLVKRQKSQSRIENFSELDPSKIQGRKEADRGQRIVCR